MRALSFGLMVITGGALALGAVGCGAKDGETGNADAAGDTSTNIIVLPPHHDAGTHHDASTGPSMDATTPQDTGFDSGVPIIPPPTDAQLNTYPSFLPNVPQVVSAGGPVWTNPIFIPVIFAGDMYETQIEAYVAAIGQSQYWKSAVGEYGVGAGVTGTPIILDETMPTTIDDGQLQVWLANELGTDPRFGALSGTSVFDAGAFDGGAIEAGAPLISGLPVTAAAPPNAIYTLFLPSGTTVTLQGSASCSSFGGYHNSFTFSASNSNVTYAVVPRCPHGFGPLQGLDAITGPASHELAEASTDPEVGGNGNSPAYVQVDEEHLLWEQVLGGGEVGDMCAQFPEAFYNPSEPSMSAYTVQRIWSNKQAALGNDPCQPALPLSEEPYYFNSPPDFGVVQAQYMGFNLSTVGASAPTGEETPIELQLFSNASTNGQNWTVQAFDANSITTGSAADLLFSPSSVSGRNGDTLLLNVTNLGNDGQTIHPFVLISTLGNSSNWWIGVITN